MPQCKVMQGVTQGIPCQRVEAGRGSSTTTLTSGGEAKLCRRTNRAQEVTQSCATVGVANIPRSPPAPSGGGTA